LFTAYLFFVHSVFNATVSNSEYSVERVNDIEYLMDWKNIEQPCRGLFKTLSQHLPGGTKQSHELGPVTGASAELQAETPRIKFRLVDVLACLLAHS
jgi:hypothetical protein